MESTKVEIGPVKNYKGGYDVTVFYNDGHSETLEGGLNYKKAVKIAKSELALNDKNVSEVAVIVTNQSVLPIGEKTIRWIEKNEN